MSTQSFDVTPSAPASPAVSLQPGESLKYSTSGTFTGFVKLRRSRDHGASWITIEASAASASQLVGGVVKNETKAEERYRFILSPVVEAGFTPDATGAAPSAVSLDPATGTCTTVLTSDIEALVDVPGPNPKHIVVNAAGKAKAGATSGWVVAAADNIALVTCPASKTGSTLVVPVHNLKVGTKIVGFHLLGQVEGTAAAALTIDADLRKHTSAAADVADASVGAMVQFTCAADTILSATNTRKGDLEEIVGDNETFYVLITATTGAGMDIALQAVVLEVVEP